MHIITEGFLCFFLRREWEKVISWPVSNIQADMQTGVSGKIMSIMHVLEFEDD